MGKKIRVSKEFFFEAAHALDGYDGKCKDIHGHSYKFIVTVVGEPKETEESDRGMVIDFSDLKKVVNKNVVEKYDHALILRSDSRFKGIEKHNSKTFYVDYQPTCENMLLDFVEQIKIDLPSHTQLVYAKLNETATSYAEWFYQDNQ